MTKYIPHERGRILRTKALEYYLGMCEHKRIVFFGYYDNYGLSCYKPRGMMKSEILHGGNFNQEHQLGYYKQGVN